MARGAAAVSASSASSTVPVFCAIYAPVKRARRGWAVVFLATGACARTPPAPEPAPPATEPAPPVAKEDAPHVRVAAAVSEGASATDASAPAPPSLQGKVVLHVGDSMVGGTGGLTKALESRFTAEGARFLREYKVSESLVSFDKSPRLRDLVTQHQPDVVIITLGTNDALVPHPDAYAANVRSIVKRVGARECYWMGPPLWKADTGIVAMLRDNVAPCRFFDGSKLELQRRSDGVHPTDKGGADWATAFWTFFQRARVEKAN